MEILTKKNLLSALLIAGFISLPYAASAQDTSSQQNQEVVALQADQIDWKDSPYIPNVKIAMLTGDPAKSGFYIYRIKYPNSYFQLAPNYQPNITTYTVLSGTFHMGFNKTFDKDAATSLPVNSVVIIPPKGVRYAWSDAETIVQISGMGPALPTFINKEDNILLKKQ